MAKVTVNTEENKVTVLSEGKTKTVTVKAAEQNRVIKVLTPGPKGEKGQDGAAFSGTLTGSLNVSGAINLIGSISASGNVIAQSFTGSLLGTASFAINSLTASYVPASAVDGLVLNQITSGSATASISPNLFQVNVPTQITGGLNITDTIVFNGGGTVLPNFEDVSGSIDLKAGSPNAWAELQSYDSGQYVWVDNYGAYIGTNYDTSSKAWIFDRNGLLTVPGNIVGANNLATTGSNLFTGTQTINPNGVGEAWNNSTLLVTSDNDTKPWISIVNKYNSAFNFGADTDAAIIGFDANAQNLDIRSGVTWNQFPSDGTLVARFTQDGTLNVLNNVSASSFLGNGTQLQNIKGSTGWYSDVNLQILPTEEFTLSNNLVLENTSLYLASESVEYTINSKSFKKCGKIFIGGDLLLINSYIQNNGEINVAGDIIFSGSSVIEGAGIID